MGRTACTEPQCLYKGALYCSLNTSFHYQRPRHACLRKNAVSLPRPWLKCKMESDYNGPRWTRWFLSQESVKPWDIYCRLSAICGEKACACCTVCDQIQNYSSCKETIQVAVHNWCNNTAKEWYCEAIWKFLRKWQ